MICRILAPVNLIVQSIMENTPLASTRNIFEIDQPVLNQDEKKIFNVQGGTTAYHHKH